MKPLTREWLDKADADLKTARRELRADEPNFDAVAFHSQQTAEKFIEAALCERDIPFRRTHDLVILADLVEPPELQLRQMRADLERLNVCAVESRYPGFRATADDANRSLKASIKVREIIQTLLAW